MILSETSRFYHVSLSLGSDLLFKAVIVVTGHHSVQPSVVHISVRRPDQSITQKAAVFEQAPAIFSKTYTHTALSVYCRTLKQRLVRSRQGGLKERRNRQDFFLFFSISTLVCRLTIVLSPGWWAQAKLIAVLCLCKMEMRSHRGQALNEAKLTWLRALSKQST